jgi:TRAP transporter 4TM/12TM fusion protein
MVVVALCMILYHVLIVWYPMFGELMNQNTHLGFCLVILILQGARTSAKTWKRITHIVALPVCLALVIYMALHYERLDMESGFPEPRDVVVGVLLMSAVLWLTWRSFGAIFPVMVLCAVAYALWGHHIPGVMNHPPFEFGYIVSNLSVGFQGIYGMLLNVSVNILFLLVIFGSIFEATGVTRFFLELGTLFSRHLKGGAGQTAIFSSSFVGMANGVAVANVAITGSFTIPVMKKSGFPGACAGAIEAMASTGGQLTPPIMGIAVFIMANFLGISYTDLMVKALVPAMAYYITAVLGVMLIASREEIPLSKAPVNKRALAFGAPVFVLPMGVLTAIMLLHYSPGYAAFWAILTLLLVSFLRAETRPTTAAVIENLAKGAVMGATFGAAVACIGIFVKCMTLTGATTKMSLLITGISGSSLLPALFLTMLLSILLSSSTPTVIAYVVVAFLAAPVLVEMGVSKIVAHFFVFYFAVLAAVTPPVAGAAMVASKIANAGYMKTSWESFKLVGPFFLLPYFIVNNPILLSEAQPFLKALMALVSLGIALGSLMCCCQKYCLTHMDKTERVIFAATSMLATLHGLYGHGALFGAALLLSTGLLAFQWRKKNRLTVQTS